MAKKRRKSRKKNNPATGCLVLILCAGVLLVALFPSDEEEGTSTTSPRNSPTERVITTDENNASRPTLQTQNTVTPEITTLYTNNGDIRARSCPETTTECTVIDVLTINTSVEGIQEVEGSVVGGDSTWWEVIHNGQTLYIHSSLLSQTPVEAQQVAPSIQTLPAQVQPTNIPRPQNCSTAVAMGLSPEQAAQWNHLDADNDGVACYGD